MPTEARIDTHQHLLYPDRFAYSWTRDLPDLQGSFSTERYAEAAAGTGIVGSVFVEVDVDEGGQAAEAEFFAGLAESPGSRLLGVVAAGRPEHEGFAAYLDSISHPKVKGLRRVLHTQPDELSRDARFRENVALLGERGWSFDLCVTQKQLPIGLELALACPGVQFILDHCGVPDIASHTSPDSESWRQWHAGIRALAAQPNVACKLSGIAAYATPEQRRVETLRPYFAEILDAFGSDRIVWGGDWPVCNLADGLLRWSQLTDELTADLSTHERQGILCDNARRLYRL